MVKTDRVYNLPSTKKDRRKPSDCFNTQVRQYAVPKRMKTQVASIKENPNTAVARREMRAVAAAVQMKVELHGRVGGS